MNPKQLACVVLMMMIGGIVYGAQIVHNKVVALKLDLDNALADAQASEEALETAEIELAMTKTRTQDLRRFLESWTPYVDRMQTEQEVEEAVEVSLRERGISLVISRKSEVKNNREDPVLPKSVLTTLVVEDEYSKVLNWLGDLERRLPLARVNVCRFSGGATSRQLRVDISFATPLVDLEADVLGKGGKKA
jgi:hypothetical protein